MDHSTTLARPLTPAPHAPALRILNRLLAGMERPPALRLGDAILHEFEAHPEYTLVIRDPGLLRRLVLRPDPLLLADAYFRGVIDVEGDLYSALGLKAHFETVSLTWRDKLALWRDALMLRVSDRDGLKPFGGLTSRVARRFAHRHSRQTDRAAISFHYDVSNAFYGLWLDAERVYSCAYFETPEDSLEQAQRNKLEHICRKLRLQPGDRLLDIGCGWGALVCWAAREYGVRAHGITLSQRQLEYARERIRAEGLQDLVTVELRDYRDLDGAAAYDKVSSVGMFEHVGLANLPAYFAAVQRVLRPGGLFLNHGITHDEEGWNRTVATEFINRYVFPDGELDCVSNIQLGMERAGFEIHDVEGLRPHYALTLRHWVQRLEARRDEALQEVDEVTFRIWRLYMAACALEFEAGGTGLYQIVASKRDGGAWPVPLTRRDLYRG
ncbi:MAG: cyclopropane-fatty-acyl-phospholipid synthase family protein [Rubrivivax sp.]|nr:cyclopropane-fatty-acyl-phospholipid synthase family protein [Rubrivivax sp.]MDP3611837.1 cyclopropane-fatty-acyl-phospholipid synthase family protein [Rubrivivax sp.]